MERIYLDHAATTQVKPEVLAEMLPYFTTQYGNPGGVHSYAREAKAAMDKTRSIVANALGASPDEIYFTAGGTESDNIAIRGVVRANSRKGKHIITTSIEHHAVLHTLEALEKDGYEVTYLPVDEEGFVSANQVKEEIGRASCRERV